MNAGGKTNLPQYSINKVEWLRATSFIEYDAKQEVTPKNRLWEKK